MPTIFYSWQSDISPARNKIKRALEQACRNLSRTLDTANRPELDSDVQGTYGSEPITETIFAKIDECDIFVADVTPVTSLDSGKLLPNPNVMIELGYAEKSKPRGTKLYIVITDDQFDPRLMPFDLQQPHLLLFSTNDTPSLIAERLTSELVGILENNIARNAENITTESTPWIYLELSQMRQWATAQTIEFRIRSDEEREYFLEEIRLGRLISRPEIAVPPHSTDTRCSMQAESIFPFHEPIGEIFMIVSRGHEKYEIRQAVSMSSRNDGNYDFVRVTPNPSVRRINN